MVVKMPVLIVQHNSPLPSGAIKFHYITLSFLFLEIKPFYFANYLVFYIMNFV
jgi:hypothetical protein